MAGLVERVLRGAGIKVESDFWTDKTWLLAPPAFREHTPMSRVGLTEAEARHLAAHLYALH